MNGNMCKKKWGNSLEMVYAFVYNMSVDENLLSQISMTLLAKGPYSPRKGPFVVYRTIIYSPNVHISII